MNQLLYGVNDRPPRHQLIMFALQQLISIVAGTIAVPAIVGNGMSPSAALFGAGLGTLIYTVCTKFRSPVFLGSSFSFCGSMLAAFSGGVSMSLGYFGLVIGAAMAGGVYVILSLIVRKAGVGWLNKLMPAIVTGPTVVLIGLSLSSSAVQNLLASAEQGGSGYTMNLPAWLGLICGLVALNIAIIARVYARSALRMVPFIMGIVAGYLVALLLTIIGLVSGQEEFLIIDFSAFQSMHWVPDFAFMKALQGGFEYGEVNSMGGYLVRIAAAYVPLSLVTFSEHIADHKNLSSLVGTDLLKNPGLHRTLLGDGLGTMIGGMFGGCPNTTYGESISCVGISGNASIVTILLTSVMAMVISFIAPVTALLASIPSCVMGGVCIATYGFICVSGLKIIQKSDLDDMRNLFVIAVILVTGIGSMTLNISGLTISSISVALIFGIITNIVCNLDRERLAKEKAASEQIDEEDKKDKGNQ